MTTYNIRNYQPADFNNYVLLCQEAAKLEPHRKPVSPQAIAERLAHPNYSPEQDLFVAEISGSIIGYMDVILEPGIGRVILHCWLRPEHRRRGLGKNLLGHAMHRAREAGASVVQINIMEDNTVAKMALSRLGFKYVRRFLDFELDMSGLHSQEAMEFRHLRRGEEDKLTQIQNLSFAEHWGYNPNTVETIAHRMNLSQCSPEDISLAYEGDRVIGFCWAETTRQQEGHIFMLGVAPDCRNQGIGRRLLLAGLSHLKSKGLKVAVLTVDSENESACALYQSVGFKLRTSSLWYEKAVNQDTEAN